MIFVCKDPSGDTWHYDDEKFIRMNGEQERSRISAKYIPDPIKLWEMRSKRAGRQMLAPEFRPSEATFALHKYRESLNANYNN